MPRGVYKTKWCPSCETNRPSNAYNRHIRVCEGIAPDSPEYRKSSGQRKIIHVDYNPNHGFKDGTRKQWNLGLTKENDPRVAQIGQSISEANGLKYSAEFIAEHFDDVSIMLKKRGVFLEQGERCNKCFISDWLGKPLSFELEHKNGINNDNRRENLEVLCPNCHAQTDTWRGRNNKRTLVV